MSNYNIESKIDFYNELYKSLDDIDDESDENQVCLITDEPLKEYFVKLDCGHSFNYIPLYNDIVAHKKKFNNMESSTKVLSSNQIRCPYCRNIQNNLLPYCEEEGVKKMYGVNSLDKDAVNYYPSHNTSTYCCPKCEFSTDNPSFNSEMEESVTNNKYTTCNSNLSVCKIYNTKYGDNKYYCYTHRKMIKEKYILKLKEEKLKAKEELKQKAKADKEKIKEELKQKVKEAKDAEKQKLKEEKQKAKEAEKQKIKEEKQKVKEAEKQKVNETKEQLKELEKQKLKEENQEKVVKVKKVKKQEK